MTDIIHPQEGDLCPECKERKLIYLPVENCSCNISPPCSACTDNPLTCTECGWEDEPPAQPRVSDAERAYWAKAQKEYEARKLKGTILPGGGRIFNVNSDGRSGSTMVFTGSYEGPVTAAEIYKHLGDGTFGHRGPTLFGNRFTYTKITD